MAKKTIKSIIEWKRWGEIDPLFGVASWKGKEKSGPHAWTNEEFYELGLSDWHDFLKHWQKYGIDNKNCLEIGCGSGRITMHLAKYFKTTYAVDVSEEMLNYAKKFIKDTSVTFYLTDGVKIPLPDNSVHAVFSTHVFQHFDSLSHATDYFTEISRVMTSQASFMIHLPIHKWPNMQYIFNILYNFRKYIGDVRACIKRSLIIRDLSHPCMRGLSYPIDYFYKTLPKYNFTDIIILIFVTKSNNDIHPFVLARKI